MDAYFINIDGVYGLGTTVTWTYKYNYASMPN